MKLPSVSVILPAYNAQTVISEALDSILSQTYEDFELIIINDKSTDETQKVIDAYAKKDSRIKVYQNNRNLGVGATRTKGIELARGKYICWQDSDDISLPDRIEAQVVYLEAHPKVGVVGGYIEFFDETTVGPVRKYAEDDASLRRTIFRYNPVAQPASMFRKECFEKVGMYNEKYTVSEDLEMFFRLGTQYEFGNVQQVVLKYRQSNTSLTRANLRKMEDTSLRLRKEYAKHPSYKFTFVDWCFNTAQRLTLAMPSRLRMALFAIVRGDA